MPSDLYGPNYDFQSESRGFWKRGGGRGGGLERLVERFVEQLGKLLLIGTVNGSVVDWNGYGTVMERLLIGTVRRNGQ